MAPVIPRCLANIIIIIIINIFWSICLLSSIGSKVARWKPEDGTNPEELGDTYFEGDIIIDAKSRNGLKSENSHWKNGIVPYTISDDFKYKDYNTIMAAIEEYHKKTCIKWVRWSGERDYVHFKPGNTGCWSSVGKVGGKQELNLQTPGCLTKKGTVIHEMLHAL
ncbi:Astacin precursor, putative [Pediculus humanus corporis]|uniref:Astacin, putative n=1 Tax=Pediculus humanus subsp. corporis TaxID=121224 RepID=E0W4F5_PEDHC|nr:Astacin precursor, putative [Pediculus humanus corporis]EEB20511.1 Astacin precursor, putative [Pediculus humanus corporis]